MSTDSKAAPSDEAAVSGASAFIADADVVTQRADDEMLLIHLRTNAIFELNRTGARFWELLAGGTDLASCRSQMLREYAIGEAELDEEIRTLLAALLHAGLIRRR